MKEYFKWLATNTRIRKATFRLLWFAAYVIFLYLIIREAVRDTPMALIGLLPLGAMMYYQWKEFKNRIK